MKDLWRIFKLASAKKKLTVLIFLTAILQMIVEALFPISLKLIFDLLQNQFRTGSTHINFNIFILLIGFYAFLVIIQILTRLWDAYYESKWWIETRNIVSLKIFHHLENLSISFWEKTSTGKIVEKIAGGVNDMQGIMEDVLQEIFPQFIYIIFALVVLMWVSWIFGLIILVGVPIFVITSIKFTKPLNTLQDEVRDEFEKAGKVRVETFTNIKTVKSFATELRHARELQKALEKSKSKALKRMKLYVRMNIIRFGIMNGSRIAMLTVGVYWVSQGKITVGTLVMIWSYITGIYSPLWTLSRIYDRIQQDLRSIRRIFEILDTVPEIQDMKGAYNLEKIKGSIKLEDLKFRYKNRNVINGIDLEIPEGKVMAVVGKSGVGKSTLVKLLLRFYDPQEGKILVDGYDIKDVTQKSLRENIGVVLQDTAIFNDTAYNNIAYANPKTSKNEVLKAAKTAHAHDFVKNLPEGYDTIVGERGVKLSGGEQQRINIARAILKNPPILILDEATSHLDSESEKLIQDALWKLIKGRTSIIIAHRLSTIMKADLIVVLDKGKIAEIGTHDELVRHEGIYNKLFKIQSGSYLK